MMIVFVIVLTKDDPLSPSGFFRLTTWRVPFLIQREVLFVTIIITLNRNACILWKQCIS